MRQAKKIMGLLLALILVLAMATPAFAEAGATTGSITIQPADDISLAGRTFTAYKILNAKKVGEGFVYTVPEALDAFYAGRFNLDATNEAFDAQVAEEIGKMKTNSDQLFQFAAAALEYCKEHTITGKAGAEDGANYKIPDLDMGYYVIENTGTEKPVSALLLDTVAEPEKMVKIKADVPTVDKEITSATTDPDKKTNNVSIGDTVSYKITSAVPDMTGFTKYAFVFHDTLDAGLTFNEETANVVVKVGDTTLVKCTHTGDQKHGQCYELTTSKVGEKTKIDIIFKNFIQYNTESMKNKPITVTYDVTLNENAVIDGPNVNTVKLQYSNDPSKEDKGDPDKPEPHDPDNPDPNDPTGETEPSKTKTYTTEVKLIKQNGKKERLPGAQFHIQSKDSAINPVVTTGFVFTEVEDGTGTYWKLKDGSYTTTAPVTDNPDESLNTGDLYEDVDKKYKKEKKENAAAETKSVDLWVESGENGEIILTGLGAGEYTITEVKAPDGYNLLGESITLNIAWTKPEAGSDTCTWTYTWDGEEGSNETTITNVSGNQMPSTGGIGTTIFYVVGSIMLVGAAVILITKRRVNAEK